jgi:hypothetical protein
MVIPGSIPFSMSGNILHIHYTIIFVTYLSQKRHFSTECPILIWLPHPTLYIVFTSVHTVVR